MRSVAKTTISTVLVAVAVSLGFAAAVGAQAPAAPVNDNRASAQVLGSLPASVTGTTIAATVEPTEPASTCATGTTAGSVWYTVLAGTDARIAVNLAANGKLDGVVEVYLAERSQLSPVACDQTDAAGKASITFKPTKGSTYAIRVAQLANSLAGTFSLDVFRPQPAASPPGSPLPTGGAAGAVDRVQSVSVAYSVALAAGQTYRINLADETAGACVSAALLPPGTTSFDDGTPVLRIHCGGYRVFTPPAGGGGRYSLLVTPSQAVRAVQLYHLQVARAGPSTVAPGTPLANYARVGGRLDSLRIDVVRLFRFDVVKRSDLTLDLSVPGAGELDLKLLGDHGQVIACACGGPGGSQSLQQQLNPGRYFAAVIARPGAVGAFTLVRRSRTITHTTLSIGPGGHGSSLPGQAVPITVKVAPGESGPVTVTIERFDPLFKWQFVRTVPARAAGGRATVAFRPAAVGRWRASASFAGTRAASPSSSGFANLLVAGPLRQ